MITHGHVHLRDAHKTAQFWLVWGVLFLNVSAGIGQSRFCTLARVCAREENPESGVTPRAKLNVGRVTRRFRDPPGRPK
jgi:hypothetical protein